YRDESSSPAKTRLATLLIGNKDESSGDYYAKSATQESIFFVGEHVIRSLVPDDVNRLAMNPPTEETSEEAEEPTDEVTETTTTQPAQSDDVSTIAEAIIAETPLTTETVESIA